MKSYITPLTGLTKELLDTQGVPLATAVAALQAALPRNATLVGQSVQSDVRWLGLQEGVHFAGLVDLMGMYRVWNAQYKSWSIFAQDHLAKTLLGWDTSRAHDAAGDAVKSMRLFRLAQQLREDPARWAEMQAGLLGTQPDPSFAKRFPEYEDCCMGNRKTCTCGGVFFYT